jgi:uncharacterized membrane protein YgdD (TMEM256/DUF423 family)
MWWQLAGVFGALAVMTGAFGAHGLEGRVTPERLVTWETAARYQLAHALALGLVAAHPGAPKVAGLLFTVGIVVFSGSLYLLVLLDKGWLGAITPLGGLCMIAGWIALALGR